MVKLQFSTLLISIAIVSDIAILLLNNRGRKFRYRPSLHLCVLFLFTSMSFRFDIVWKWKLMRIIQY